MVGSNDTNCDGFEKSKQRLPVDTFGIRIAIDAHFTRPPTTLPQHPHLVSIHSSQLPHLAHLAPRLQLNTLTRAAEYSSGHNFVHSGVSSIKAVAGSKEAMHSASMASWGCTEKAFVHQMR